MVEATIEYGTAVHELAAEHIGTHVVESTIGQIVDSTMRAPTYSVVSSCTTVPYSTVASTTIPLVSVLTPITLLGG